MKGWHFYAILAVIVWGVWGFLTKWSVDKLGSLQAYLAISLGAIILPIFFIPFIHLPAINLPFWIAVGTGILGSIGTLLLARAFTTGQTNVVIPITAQYILVTVILARLFYQEHLPLTRIIGIILSILAIILLSK
ncbi:MAG: EamA family transporter [candidate division WOR-3 bacterium]